MIASDTGGVARGFAFVEVNAVKALRVISPSRVFLRMFLLYGIGLLLVPVVPAFRVSAAPVVFWILLVGCTYAALIGVAPRRAAAADRRFLAWEFPARRLARRCIAIGALGVVLAIVDRYIIRGAPLTFDIFEVRDAVEVAGSGAVGVAAAATSSFAAFGLLLARFSRVLGQPLGFLEESFAAVVLGFYLVLSVALGSRSLIVVCILLHLLAGIFFQYLRRGRVSWGTISGLLWALLILVFGSAWIMLRRVDLVGSTIINSIQYSGYAYTLQPSAALVDALNSGSDLGYFGAAVYSLVLYVYHGFYEFCLLFDSYASPHLMGAQFFWLPLRLIAIVTGIDLTVDNDDLVGSRSGIYTTFAGPMFLDFGLLAPLFAAALFALLGVPFRRLVAGDWRWLPAALQVTVIILMAPVVSLLDSSVGMFLLLAACLLPLLAGRAHRPAS
jgi:hypothetical protein